MPDPVAYLERATLYPRSKYVSELRPGLPPATFEPATSRILFVPFHVAIIALASVAIARGWLPWPVVPLAAIVIGISWSCLTFVAHETLHGGIVRGKRLQYAVGFLGFLPFFVSPRLWMAWHNRDHHANTNLPDDPDAYATIAQYKTRATTRFAVDQFSPGGRRLRGVLALLFGFTGQSGLMLVIARSRGFLTPRQVKLVYVETALALALWATVGVVVGLVPFLFIFVIPHIVANTMVMAFILTNHSLSPRVEIDDPLVSGLTVTTSRFTDWLTLSFGLHVEHHLFPAMSTRNAPAVRKLLLEKWPDRYQSMPLVTALLQLHRTARVYKDATTLFDPSTGQEFQTLLPATRSAESAATSAATSEVAVVTAPLSIAPTP